MSSKAYRLYRNKIPASDDITTNGVSPSEQKPLVRAKRQAKTDPSESSKQDKAALSYKTSRHLSPRVRVCKKLVYPELVEGLLKHSCPPTDLQSRWHAQRAMTATYVNPSPIAKAFILPKPKAPSCRKSKHQPLRLTQDRSLEQRRALSCASY